MKPWIFINLVISVVIFAVSAVCEGAPVIVPPGTIEFIPVQTVSTVVTAIAQPARWDPVIYPALVRVIAPLNGQYGLFKLSDKPQLIYGPAEVNPESLA